MDKFTEDVIWRARWARDHNDGHPKPAWSTGEKLAVALVLDDQEFFAASAYTAQDAILRVTGDTGVTEINAWLVAVRGRVFPGAAPTTKARPDSAAEETR